MNTTRLESARTEIEIMKICQHPNIIRFIDSYEDADKIYIFMVISLLFLLLYLV